MIVDFGNKVASDIYHNGRSSKLPRELWERAYLLLDIMDNVDSIEDLKRRGQPPSLRPHKLKGDKRGRMAIDITKLSGWRITFIYDGEFKQVKIEDYH